MDDREDLTSAMGVVFGRNWKANLNKGPIKKMNDLEKGIAAVDRQTQAAFVDLALQLWGVDFTAKAARALEIDYRTIQRYVTGERRVPNAVIEFLQFKLKGQKNDY